MIKKNDLVQVIAGSAAGSRGRVLGRNDKGDRLLIEGVALVHKHLKPTKDNPRGGRVKRESGIAVSNLMLVCPKCDRPVRVRSKKQDKDRLRSCVRCGEDL